MTTKIIISHTKEVMSMFGLDFLGIEKDYQKQKSSLPINKEKGVELTAEKKEYNRNHSAKRILIEHIIFRIKKYRIMKYYFRNKLRKYDSISVKPYHIGLKITTKSMEI